MLPPRLPAKPWHFECDGEIVLIANVPLSMIQIGDTAGGYRNGVRWLYRCVALDDRTVDWRPLMPWSPAEQARVLEQAAKTVLVTPNEQHARLASEHGTPVVTSGEPYVGRRPARSN